MKALMQYRSGFACAITLLIFASGASAAESDADSAPRTTTAPCCAPQNPAAAAAFEAADLPWADASLRNKFCPVTGDPTDPNHFVDYRDEKAGIFARIYTCGAECTTNIREQDLKAHYVKAFLTLPDDRQAPYGTVRQVLKNQICPVSGVGKKEEGRTYFFHPTLSANCTAGACSTADGYKLNFNAARINICCPTCGKTFAQEPDSFLPNIRADIEGAVISNSATDSE